MKHLTFYSVLSLFFVAMACKSDDDNEIRPVITSFSGSVLYEQTMEPVTSADLFITGRDSRGITGSIVRVDTILRIEDGTFEVSFETVEEIDRFGMFIDILKDEFIINTFVAGSDPPLKCLPGNCANFPPGQDYELTILVPCAPDDCVQFPLP